MTGNPEVIPSARKVGFAASSGSIASWIEVADNPVFRALRRVRIVGQRGCFRVADKPGVIAWRQT
jgi:hypothetical protein